MEGVPSTNNLSGSEQFALNDHQFNQNFSYGHTY
jgi:hypothetical protein